MNPYFEIISISKEVRRNTYVLKSPHIFALKLLTHLQGRFLDKLDPLHWWAISICQYLDPGISLAFLRQWSINLCSFVYFLRCSFRRLCRRKQILSNESVPFPRHHRLVRGNIFYQTSVEMFDIHQQTFVPTPQYPRNRTSLNQ